MRKFNTSGPCHPARHYTIMREALIAEGQERVQQGQYFTLFAPRQTGKTTYFQLLLEKLKEEGFIPIWISFEKLKTVTRARFYRDLNNQLHKRLAKHQNQLEPTLQDQIDLVELFENLKNSTPKPLVLVIDEFEGIPDSVLSEIMHSFRDLYHQKEYHALHSLILVGVSTIAELVVSPASPFNVADELKIPYFTFEEVNLLINQSVVESGQAFEKKVIKVLYENTQGQPGLVCALAAHLVENQATRRTVTMADFFLTLNDFLKSRYDKNILNVVQKAKEKKAFMLRLLFNEEPIDFSVYVEDIAYLQANGIINNINGHVGIQVPLYSK